MVSITVNYEGDLRTSSIHLKSQNSLITDAPTDNNGKGEAFSPTDLLATSLATCMITVMGIEARKREIHYEDISAEVEKVMTSSPRKVQAVNIKLKMKGGFSDKERTILEHTGRNCPVALSLSEELVQNVEFVYE
jgi:putative redox protein